MDLYYVGEIVLFPYSSGYNPEGFLLCDGSIYSAYTYQVLFALIGTTYGGTMPNFAVPNLMKTAPFSDTEKEIKGMRYYICWNGVYPSKPY